jgi:hypothetical protein
MNLRHNGWPGYWIWTTVLLLLTQDLYTAPAGNPLADFAAGKVRASGLDAVFYSNETPSRKCLVLRAERIFTDYEKRGPFRLGVLPVFVLEGVTISVPQPEEALAALTKTETLLTPAAKGRAEMRRARLVIRAGDGKTNVIEAGLVTVAQAGELKLKGEVRITGSCGEFQGSSAQLHTAGSMAGSIILQTSSGAITGNLFTQDLWSEQPIKTTQHENPSSPFLRGVRIAHLPERQQSNGR